MAPESQRDSFPNHSCSLLPASHQLGPLSLSKSHLNEAPALLNSTLISTFFLLYWPFLLYLPRELSLQGTRRSTPLSTLC